MSEPYLGTIMAIAFDFVPDGFALCDGSMLLISEHQTLYAIIGVKFGGDGRTTFALPDLRSRATIGAGSGAHLTSRTLGEYLGEETVKITMEQMPVHNHRAYAVPSATQVSPNYAYWGGEPFGMFPVYGDTGTAVALANNALGTAGGDEPHDNMSPYLTLNYVIAIEGTYPPR